MISLLIIFYPARETLGNPVSLQWSITFIITSYLILAPGDIIILNQSLTGSKGNIVGNCIEFDGSDSITFDCDGHTIDGDDVGTDYGIWLNDTGDDSNYNVIRNCTIGQFDRGIGVLSSEFNNFTNINPSSIYC